MSDFFFINLFFLQSGYRISIGVVTLSSKWTPYQHLAWAWHAGRSRHGAILAVGIVQAYRWHLISLI